MGINRWHCVVGSCARQLLFVRFDRRIADGESATENCKSVMELGMGRLDCSRHHLCVRSCRCGTLNWDNSVEAFFNAGGPNDIGNGILVKSRPRADFFAARQGRMSSDD